MKKIAVRFRAINKPTFDAIRDGRKTVETRAGTIKYKNAEPGDILVLSCGKEKFERSIKKVARYRTVREAFAEVPFQSIDPYALTPDDAEAAYYTYPGYKEKIVEFGIIAFFL